MRKKIGCFIMAMIMALNGIYIPKKDVCRAAESISAQETDNVSISSGETVIPLSLENGNSAVIKEDGTLYIWGAGYSGQIGDGKNTNRLLPTEIMENVRVVCLGYDHSAAITNDGTLYMWGSNSYGQIGDGTDTSRMSPVEIMKDVKTVSLGSYHSAAVTNDGGLYMWGYNRCGQLGDGTMTDSWSPVKIMDNVRTVSLGLGHSAAITKDNELYMWGDKYWSYAEEGVVIKSLTPVRVMEDVKSVSLGADCTAVVTLRGDLYMRGYNGYGQLGNGTTADTTSFEKIMENIESVSLKGWTTAAITYNGRLFVWGDNRHGQVGNNSTENQLVPDALMDDVAMVSLGHTHSAALLKDGSVYLWGENTFGQIGNDSTKDQLVPLKILEGAMQPQYENGNINDAPAEWDFSLSLDGVLTIKGNGDMPIWNSPSDVPWYYHTSEIRKVVIESGIESIGKWAFYGCKYLTDIVIPDTVSRVDIMAFCGCMNLKEIEFPGEVTEIGYNSFFCSGVNKIVFHEAVMEINSQAFVETEATIYFYSAKGDWKEIAYNDYGGSLIWIDLYADSVDDTTSAVTLDYKKKYGFWGNDYSLPGVPSTKISEYATELYQWARVYGYEDILTRKVCDEIVRKYTPTVVYAEDSTVFTEDEYKTWEIMRDIIMLDSMKDSINKWEDDYLKNVSYIDLNKTQKKIAAITGIYSDYIDSTERSPLNNALYNCYALKLLKKNTVDSFKVKKTYKAFSDFWDDKNINTAKGIADNLTSYSFEWVNSGIEDLEDIFVLNQGKEVALDKTKNVAKNIGKNVWKDFVNGIIAENEPLSDLNSLKNDISSYTGSFKSYAAMAEYTPGILFTVQILKSAQKVFDTIADTKGSQYFMIQYYTLLKMPEVYDSIIDEDGNIIDMITYQRLVLDKKIPSNQEAFMNELMTNWYKTTDIMLKTQDRLSLATLASTTVSLKQTDVESLREAIVEYWAKRTLASSLYHDIYQIQYISGGNGSFYITDENGNKVGTYQNGEYYPISSKTVNLVKMSLVSLLGEDITVEENTGDTDLIVTYDEEENTVAVVTSNPNYKIHYSGEEQVFVSVQTFQQTSSSQIYTDIKEDIVLGMENGNVVACDTNNAQIAPGAEYTPEQGIADYDASVLELQYTGADTSDYVTGNILLDTEGVMGSTIEWSSDKEDIISKDGIVTRAEQDELVTLTAKVTYGDKTAEKEFEVLVSGKWLTVWLVADGEDIGTLSVEAGKALDMETFMSYVPDGHNVDGWYYDEEHKYQYYDNQVIEENVTLYTTIHGDTYKCNENVVSGSCASNSSYEEVQYCTICNKEVSRKKIEGSKNSNNHVGGTYVTNAKVATCSEDGYTGDICCKACNGKITLGTATAKTSHKWNSGKVTKGETTKKSGLIVYSCEKCGATKNQKLAKLKIKKTAITKVTFAKKGSTKSLLIKWKKISGVKGYQIRYSNKGNMKKAKMSFVKANSKKLKVSSLYKKCYIQIRAYKINSAGQKVYGAWSKKRIAKMK